MKNLKIRTKILASFGVVILITIIFAVFVISSSFNTMRNVQNMREESNMQNLSSNLTDHFGLVSLGAKIISVSFDDAEYESIVLYFDECEKILNEMDTLIDSNNVLSGFKTELLAVKNSVDEWSATIDNLQASNKTLQDIISKAQYIKLDLDGRSRGIFDYQLRLSRDEARLSNLTTEEKLRRVTRIETGFNIGNSLDYIASSFDVMFRTMDVSNVQRDLNVITQTKDLLTDFLADSGLQYNIETATAMLQSLSEYENHINDFLSTVSARSTLVDAERATGTRAINEANSLLNAVTTSTFTHADATIATAQTSLIFVIILAAGGLIIAVLSALYISGIIASPLHNLSLIMTKLFKTGNVVLHGDDEHMIHKYKIYNDEIGEISAAVHGVLQMLNNKTVTLNDIANGNLAANIIHRSDQDTIGLAMQKMSDSLNAMFREIRLSTEQVASGSRQIADGAQALAQGSTEQAASVEQLSASVAEVAQKTKDNAELANRAAGLANTIIKSAELGAKQMEQMLAAVSEISQASQDINKVIKVIDEIAFQTNILALNAAVEAARAGQHGKGFAVVAEEVRNLAAKSATAAKDTEALIANSIEKANLGADIAVETSTSLSDIVSGINESSKIVSDIARSSDDQSRAVEQINIGINQVAQVVQQNSATAQESAAASQQMSSQSAILENLIARFVLSDHNALPASNSAPFHNDVPVIKHIPDQHSSPDFGKY